MLNEHSQAPLITIGLTCYNAEDTIIDAIESCFNQDWPNIEVIVVDDYSTDSSALKIANYVIDKKVKFIKHQANKKYAASLNTIINNASGEFIAFFDSDDFSTNNRLSLQYNRIKKYEQLKGTKKILCYGYRNVIKVGDQEIDHVARSIGGNPAEPYGTAVADYFLRIKMNKKFDWGDGVLGSCTLLSRTDNFKNILFDESFKRAAEIDFAIRASFEDFHFISVNTPIITMQKTIASYKSPEIDYENWFKVYQKNKEYLILKNSVKKSFLGLKAAYFRKKRNMPLYYFNKIRSTINL